MQRNTQPVTRELCDNNILIFLPATTEEAAFIQRALFALGYKWAKSESAKVASLEVCIEKGMVLIPEGKDSTNTKGLYVGPLGQHFQDGLLCTPEQLDADYVAMPSPSFLEKFNALADKVDTIHNEIVPRRINKGPRLDP